MKKLVLVMMVLACAGLALSACGSTSGPHCAKNPMYCDPVCNSLEGKYCCDNTCIDMMTCDPACLETQYCDPCSGTCKANPQVCDPVCPTGQYCDNGTCKPNPVCDPVCAADELCVP